MTDENTQAILQRLDQRFNEIDQRFNTVDQRIDSLDQRISKLDSELKAELRDANTRIDTYQKTSTQITGLAFGIVSTAGAVVILAPAVKALTEFFLSK